MDISLFLGILGVALTIIFFVIGYRQTIGARRERARSANQALVDTIFRRLALEENFSLTRSDLAKAISGWAINARVKSSDIYSLQELEDILSSKALESDYVAESQRITIGKRISKMFSEEQNSFFITKDYPEQNKVRAELLLAIASGLASMVMAIFATLFLSGEADGTATKFVESAITPLTGLIILTSIVLLVYTRVRDISRPGADELDSNQAIELDVERAFYAAARSRSKAIKPSNHPRFDFVLESNEGLVGIEVKRDINRIRKSLLSRMIQNMKSTVDSGIVSKVIIASAIRPDEKTLSLGDDKVCIVYIQDFLSSLSENRRPQD